MEGAARHRGDVQGRLALAEEESLRIRKEELSGLSGLTIIGEAIAALKLERELGVREVEISPVRPQAAPPPPPVRPQAAPPPPPVRPQAAPVKSQTPDPKPQAEAFDFVFLHDRALSPKGIEFMAKAVLGLKRTAESAPIVIDPAQVPKAKVYVVLGARALAKFVPGRSAAPDTWMRGPDGREYYVTYSPEYFLRFSVVTPAITELKRKMWSGLKQVAGRCESRV